MLTALVRAIVEGIIRPLIAAWSQYLLGRRSLEKELAEAALRSQKEFEEKLAQATAKRGILSPERLRALFERERARRGIKH